MPGAGRIEKLKVFLEDDPDDEFTLYALAQEHAKIEKFDEAVAYFERCIAVKADYSAAYFHLGKTLARVGRADEARDVLTRGIGVAAKQGDIKTRDEMQEELDALES